MLREHSANAVALLRKCDTADGQGLSRVADADLPPQGSRIGDAMMGRFTASPLAAPQVPPKMEAVGSVNITLEGEGLAKAKARTTTDGMFRDVHIHRGRQMAMAVDGYEDR
jgi:hypothetical protein